MSYGVIQDTTLESIADAIIAKDNGQAMYPNQMATRIANIQTGGVQVDYIEDPSHYSSALNCNQYINHKKLWQTGRTYMLLTSNPLQTYSDIYSPKATISIGGENNTVTIYDDTTRNKGYSYYSANSNVGSIVDKTTGNLYGYMAQINNGYLSITCNQLIGGSNTITYPDYYVGTAITINQLYCCKMGAVGLILTNSSTDIGKKAFIFNPIDNTSLQLIQIDSTVNLAYLFQQMPYGLMGSKVYKQGTDFYVQSGLLRYVFNKTTNTFSALPNTIPSDWELQQYNICPLMYNYNSTQTMAGICCESVIPLNKPNINYALVSLNEEPTVKATYSYLNGTGYFSNINGLRQFGVNYNSSSSTQLVIPIRSWNGYGVVSSSITLTSSQTKQLRNLNGQVITEIHGYTYNSSTQKYEKGNKSVELFGIVDDEGHIFIADLSYRNLRSMCYDKDNDEFVLYYYVTLGIYNTIVYYTSLSDCILSLDNQPGIQYDKNGFPEIMKPFLYPYFAGFRYSIGEEV